MKKSISMSNPDRKFKGIWIPAEIWLSNELTMQEKLFYVEIDSLDNKDGCFAKNKHFADFFGISSVRVSKVINSLCEKGLVNSVINTAAGNERILRINKNYILPSQTKVNDPSQTKVNEGCKQKLTTLANKSLTPVIGINNTVNNKSNNTYTPAPEKPEIKKTISHVDRPQPKTDIELKNKILIFLNDENDISQEARRAIFEKISRRKISIPGGLTLSETLAELVDWWACRHFAKNRDLNMNYAGFVAAFKNDLDYYNSVQPDIKKIEKNGSSKNNNNGGITTRDAIMGAVAELIEEDRIKAERFSRLRE